MVTSIVLSGCYGDMLTDKAGLQVKGETESSEESRVIPVAIHVFSISLMYIFSSSFASFQARSCAIVPSWHSPHIRLSDAQKHDLALALTTIEGIEMFARWRQYDDNVS